MKIVNMKWIKILVAALVLVAVGIIGYKAKTAYIERRQAELARQARVRKELVHQAAQQQIKSLLDLSIVDLNCTQEEKRDLEIYENNMEEVKNIVQKIVVNRIDQQKITMQVAEMSFDNNVKLKKENLYLWDNALEERYEDTQKALSMRYLDARNKKGFLEASQIAIGSWDAKKAQAVINEKLKQPIPPA